LAAHAHMFAGDGAWGAALLTEAVVIRRQNSGEGGDLPLPTETRVAAGDQGDAHTTWHSSDYAFDNETLARCTGAARLGAGRATLRLTQPRSWAHSATPRPNRGAAMTPPPRRTATSRAVLRRVAPSSRALACARARRGFLAQLLAAGSSRRVLRLRNDQAPRRLLGYSALAFAGRALRGLDGLTCAVCMLTRAPASLPFCTQALDPGPRGRSYEVRYRTCRMHMRAAVVDMPEGPRRFCQKCSGWCVPAAAARRGAHGRARGPERRSHA